MAAVNIVDVVRAYIGRALAAPPLGTLTSLLVDAETQAVVDATFSATALAERNCMMVQRLDAQHAGQRHLTAVCVLRPTPANLRALLAQLRAMPTPPFAAYYLSFTAAVPQATLQTLADADAAHAVRCVQEVYADVVPLRPDLYSVERAGLALDGAGGVRVRDALLGVMLGLKTRPFVRFHGVSPEAAALARTLVNAMTEQREALTFAPSARPTLLLVLDRREDPVTPLLLPWTYAAMLHELLRDGIQRNVVAVGSTDSGQAQRFALTDPFFERYRDANYGDLAAAVREMVEAYTARKAAVAARTPGGLAPDATAIASMEDMRAAIEALPELMREGAEVGKHVTLVTALSDAVTSRHLLALSEVEQDVATMDAAVAQAAAVIRVLQLPDVSPEDALRLVALYTLRYERAAPERVREVTAAALTAVPRLADRLDALNALLAYAGADARRGGSLLFGSRTVLKKLTAAVVRGLRDAPAVLTAHEPLLTTLLTQLARGSLSRVDFPYAGDEPVQAGGVAPSFERVLVFIVGGVTFAEAAVVNAINRGKLTLLPTPTTAAAVVGAVTAATTVATTALGAVTTPRLGATGGRHTPPGAAGSTFRVLLGGTQVLNSSRFIDQAVAAQR